MAVAVELAAVAPIGPLAWELSYAVNVALKRKKKKKKPSCYSLLFHLRKLKRLPKSQNNIEEEEARAMTDFMC